MPIKFRCQQCRQFLGISRAQAGEVVDCPTCGRTIRVPELDGTVKPLPEPGLRFDDTRLKNALDEIAQISDETPLKNKPHVEGAVAGSANREDGKAVSRPGIRTLDEPQPIELPPLSAPEPVALGPLPQRDIDYGAAADDEAFSAESLEEDRPWRSTAQPRDSWKQLIAAAALKEREDWERSEETPKSDDKAATDSQQARDEQVRQPEEIPPALPVLDRESASLRFSTWFAIVGLIVLICSAGFWIGRSTAITWSVDRTSFPASVPSPANDERLEARRPLKSCIEGRITSKSETSGWAADRDACVVVLPVERKGVSLISFVGLRREDSDEDREVLRSALRAMGGAVEFADENGLYQIELTEPGEYHLLILSRSAGRSKSSDDEATIQLLDGYFERAGQMLGELAYRFETIRFSGNRAVPIDAAFESKY
jgi:hypothetical protein